MSIVGHAGKILLEVGTFVTDQLKVKYPHLELKFHPDELHWVDTADSWQIAIGRYRPKGNQIAKFPVILCHGLGVNRFNLDFNKQYSVARYLSEKGFDTWVLELRGRGLSSPYAMNKGFGFDDQVRYDIPAAIERVLHITHASKALWVGHSKGGMMMYGYLALHPKAPIAGVITIGSPSRFDVQPRLGTLFRHLSPFMNQSRIKGSKILKASSSIIPVRLIPNDFINHIVNPDNMDELVMRKAMFNLVTDVAVGVITQFQDWAHTGKFQTLDRTTNYLEALKHVDVPFLFLVGKADILTPEEAIIPAYEYLASKDKTVKYLGKSEGFQADYGHGDMVLGISAPEEVFPIIYGWLKDHTPWSQQQENEKIILEYY